MPISSNILTGGADGDKFIIDKQDTIEEDIITDFEVDVNKTYNLVSSLYLFMLIIYYD